jgi:hypothetical protein
MSGPVDNPALGAASAVKHEESDVNVRAIFGFGAGLLAVAIAIHVLVWLLFLVLSARARTVETPVYPLATTGDRVPPEPRLQIAPRQDLLDLRAREALILGTYGWIDRNAGIVRIPIDEAVRLTLERGLPVRPQKGGQP